MEPTLSCPMAKLHKRTMSRQNGINDLQTWVAQQVEEYEALLVTSSSGELEVNPVFFTPPSKTKQRPIITPQPDTSTFIQGSDTSAARSASSDAGLSSYSISKNPQQRLEPESCTTQDLGHGKDSPPHASSDIPTLFRKPINWDEEAFLLEEQDVASHPALPELAQYAISCSDTDHQQPRTPGDTYGEHPYVTEEPSPKWTQEVDHISASGMEHASAHIHDSLTADRKEENHPLPYNPAPQQIHLHASQQSQPDPESTTTVSLPSLLPAKRQSSSTTTTSGGPAKKARPTTEIFTQNMTSQPSTQAQPASEMLKQMIGNDTPRHEQEK